MQTKFIARKLKKDEWQKYRKIRLEALKNDPQAFGSSYESEIHRSDREWEEILMSSDTDGSKTIFVGIDKNNDDLLAIGGAYAENDLGEWNIIAIYVDPEHRGQGIGKILLSEIIDILKARRDIKRLMLRVNVNQRAAINLYTRLGFVTTKTVRNQLLGDGNLYDEFEMMLDLDDY
jgi:RimJ/RimL family protein N-acetyltransferase